MCPYCPSFYSRCSKIACRRTRAPHASPALRAVTLNNAGIYYARTGQPQAALRCLERVGKQGGVVVEQNNPTPPLCRPLARLGQSHERRARVCMCV